VYNMKLSLIIFALMVASSSGFCLQRTVMSSQLTAVEKKRGISIEIGDGESIESAMRRFKKEVNKSGHLMELRHRRYFENGQEVKKRKVVQARNRRRIERMNKVWMKKNVYGN